MVMMNGNRLLTMSATLCVLLAAGLAPSSRAQIDPWQGEEFDPAAILVRFDSATPAHLRQDIRDMLGGETLRSFRLVPGLEKVSTVFPVEDALWMLEGNPFILYAEPDYRIHPASQPNDTNFANQWGAHNTGQSIRGILGVNDADMDLPEAWDIHTGDGNFVIAVLDTGVDLDHPDLDNNLWVNSGETPGNGIDDDGNGYIDDINGWDFRAGDNDANDEGGHGTLCSGIIGAEGDNGAGVAGGIWDCRIMALRIFDGSGGTVSDAIQGLEYAADKNVRLSNNSWTAGSFSNALYDAIEALQSIGHIVIAAAGNDSSNIDTSPQYPAAFDLDNILSVAATTNEDGLAGFSNWGAVSVDVGAPGRDVYSTRRGGTYNWFSGTSAAAPSAAGVVALLMDHNPGWTYHEVLDRILETARPISALDGKCVTGGVINAYEAIRSDNQPPAEPGRPTVTDLGGGVAHIEWADNSSNEDIFKIQRQKKLNDGTWGTKRTVGTVGTNVTEFEDDAGFGTWRYRVRAINSAGASSWSQWRKVVLD
jgi:hypothetical protein